VRPVDPWAVFVWACRATWHELGRVIAVSLVWLLSGVPFTVSLVAGEAWLIALAALPVLIGTTGLFGSLAESTRGGSVRVPGPDRFDVSLAGLAWVWLLAIAWGLGGGPVGVVASSILGAFGVLALPLALAYSAVTHRQGPTALRGAVIVGILQPGLTVTLAGGTCLAAFACVASAGTLLVVAPALVVLMACRTVRLLVDPEDDAGEPDHG
jgi:hypothetical protein